MIAIDWAAFGVVLGVSLLAAVGIVVFYSAGLRLLAVGKADGPDDGRTGTQSAQRPPLATLAAAACFTVCIAAVLFGVWLIVPQFH